MDAIHDFSVLLRTGSNPTDSNRFQGHTGKEIIHYFIIGMFCLSIKPIRVFGGHFKLGRNPPEFVVYFAPKVKFIAYDDFCNHILISAFVPPWNIRIFCKVIKKQDLNRIFVILCL